MQFRARCAPIPALPRFIDVRELVRSNRLFRRLAATLRLTDAEARVALRGALAWAGTSPTSLGPVELRFMLPRIETDVLVPLRADDAQLRRESLERLLAWVDRELPVESDGSGERSGPEKSPPAERSGGAGPGYARLA